MNEQAEFKYISKELEHVAESLAELVDAIHVYQHRDVLCRDIYERIENLRAQAFQLHDEITTLAKNDEEEES